MTSTQDVINHIKTIPSLEQLDNFSTRFFSKYPPSNYPDVINAISRREEELEEMGYDPYDIDVAVEIPETTSKVASIDLVCKRPAPKKEAGRIYKHAEHVECGCKSSYGVPCLHKLHLDEIGPDDYEECETCGFSHFYDVRLACEFHSHLKDASSYDT